MIGRLYSFATATAAISAAQDLMELGAPADAVCLIERMYIGNSDFNTSENVSATCGLSASGTGTDEVAAGNIVPLQAGDAAFAGTFESNHSIDGIPTANSIFVNQGFNVLSGWLWTPASDDEVITLSPSAVAIVRIATAPTSMTLNYGMTFREIGG